MGERNDFKKKRVYDFTPCGWVYNLVTCKEEESKQWQKSCLQTVLKKTCFYLKTDLMWLVEMFTFQKSLFHLIYSYQPSRVWSGLQFEIQHQITSGVFIRMQNLFLIWRSQESSLARPYNGFDLFEVVCKSKLLSFPFCLPERLMSTSKLQIWISSSLLFLS